MSAKAWSLNCEFLRGQAFLCLSFSFTLFLSFITYSWPHTISHLHAIQCYVLCVLQHSTFTNMSWPFLAHRIRGFHFPSPKWRAHFRSVDVNLSRKLLVLFFRVVEGGITDVIYVYNGVKNVYIARSKYLTRLAYRHSQLSVKYFWQNTIRWKMIFSFGSTHLPSFRLKDELRINNGGVKRGGM